MRKININDNQLRVHYRVQDKVLDKAIRMIKYYSTGEIKARKLNCGYFEVLDVTHRDRIVIKDNKFNLMSHEQYNKFIERR